MSVPKLEVNREAELVEQADSIIREYDKKRKFLIRRNKAPKILLYPDKKLKQVAEPVDFSKINLKKRTDIVRKMGAALGATDHGMKLGIAATQIGINKRIIIVRGNVLFNPEWTPCKGQVCQMVESCYSVPKRMFNVYRPKYGWLKYTNINGQPVSAKVHGVLARVLQHELSHLDGKCCIEEGEEIDGNGRAIKKNNSL